MKTIIADFNALSDEERIWLNSIESTQSIREQGVAPGDWVWLTDDDLFVVARVVDDPEEGRVGEPVWQTLADVSLLPDQSADQLFEDDQRQRDKAAQTPNDIRWQLARLHRLAQLRLNEGDATFGPIRYGRALCLRDLHQDHLALAEIEPALRIEPANPNYQWLALDLLGRTDPQRALMEARRYADAPNVHPNVLAVRVQILGADLDAQPETAFREGLPTLLEWAERFRAASERDEPSTSARVMVLLNLGLAKLRAGRSEDAVRDFDALLERTEDPDLREALQQLVREPCYDERARQLARRFHDNWQAA